MRREKRSRACKLYDAYRIIALYRELFDVCRFASTPTYRLFHHESARTPRGQKVKVNKKHRRFLERSNEVMESVTARTVQYTITYYESHICTTLTICI